MVFIGLYNSERDNMNTLKTVLFFATLFACWACAMFLVMAMFVVSAKGMFVWGLASMIAGAALKIEIDNLWM